MISLMPCAEASIVSPMGTPSRNMRTAACPFVSTQSSVTPFQHHVETAAMNVATRLRPERDLDPKAEELIVGWGKGLPRDASLALVEDLDHEA